MKRQQFVLLIVALVVLGGAALLLNRRNENSWNKSAEGSGGKILGDFDVNTVAAILIQQHTNTLTLVRSNETWTVRERGGYPANFSDIADSLTKLADMKAIRTIPVGASQRPKLELGEPATGTNSGTLVELKDASGKALKSVLLGKRYTKQSGQASPFGDEGFPAGRYVLSLPAGDRVAIVSDALNSLDPKASAWLNKDFFKVEKVKSVAVVSTVASNSWAISRASETNDWVLADAKPTEKIDAAKVSGSANALSMPSFTDVVSSGSKSDLGLDNATKVSITTFEGFTYELQIGKAADENYPLTVTVAGSFTQTRTPGKDEKPDDKEKADKEFKESLAKLEERLKAEKKVNGWTYLVSKWTLDPLLRDRAQLLVEEKKEEPPKEAK